MRGNYFLVYGHKKDLPHITCIFHLLKHLVKLFLTACHFYHVSLLRLLPKSYFKVSTFQPIFCALAHLRLVTLRPEVCNT